MNIAERFDKALDEHYAKKERDRYLCCRVGMSNVMIRSGLKRWQETSAFTCESCGTQWQRTPDGQWAA